MVALHSKECKSVESATGGLGAAVVWGCTDISAVTRCALTFFAEWCNAGNK